MTASTELTVAEQPQQLITIEPTKYVELVFEPFAKRLADAKELARTTTYDVKTTAGMATAVKIRATFRDIRVASEKARKERKAPILEIGKLLDSRQKEIEAEIEPFESEPDAAIKAEEKRKDDEKIAKAVAESARITKIRTMVDELKAVPAESVGRSSADLAATIEILEMHEVTLAEFFEFSGEAEVAKHGSLAKLREMLTAQQAIEAEQVRLASEREAIERQRAELAEQERLAAVAREEQEAKDRAERERVEAEQREAQEKAAEAMRVELEQHEARMCAERAEIQRQQDELNRAREAAEAEARAKREAEEAAARVEAQRIADERAEEARRIQAEKDADEAERIRRERADFLNVGPGDQEIIALVAKSYGVPYQTACNWIAKIEFVDFTDDEEKAA